MKIPGPPKSFASMIDAAQVNREGKNTKKYFPLRPSSAGSCQKKLAFELSEYLGLVVYEKQPRKAETIRIFSLGHSVEWQAIRQFETLFEQEPKYELRDRQQTVTLFTLDDGTLIEGSIDLAVKHPEYGNGIIDVKSKKDGFSAAFKSKWDQSIDQFNKMSSLQVIDEQGWYAPDLKAFLNELNDPWFASNFQQLNSYLCTDWAKEHGMIYGSIKRDNKNDSRHLEIRFAPSEELFQELKQKFNRVNTLVRSGKLKEVPKDYVLGSQVCAFCDFQKECWGDQDALKAYFKTFPPKKWPVDADERLEAIHENYTDLVGRSSDKDLLEEQLVKELVEQGIEKVRFSDGSIYDVKYLKSAGVGGKGGFVLRRGKL